MPSTGPRPFLEDLHDALHPPRRECLRIAALLLLAVVAVAAIVLLAGCSLPPTQQPPTRVCGTTGAEPVRVADHVCTAHHAPDDGTPVNGPTSPIRWYTANPAELEPDDWTDVGDLLDDDYRDDLIPAIQIIRPPARAPLPVPQSLTRTTQPAPTAARPGRSPDRPRTTAASPSTTRRR